MRNELCIIIQIFLMIVAAVCVLYKKKIDGADVWFDKWKYIVGMIYGLGTLSILTSLIRMIKS